jgi:hypothetical protein
VNGPATIIGRLDNTSDRLSPLLVKEVRQIVRGKEFVLSFGLSLLAGLAVAFFGAADALAGGVGAGGWTFGALMGCLAFLGLAVVPLGAFSALRSERMQQTLELITLTALSPRRIVIGKLLAQSVKLVTLFAAIAPFIAMSFLLGGIDFLTIVVAVAVLFMWSLWVAALCLFFSAAFNSRAMAVVVFVAIGLVVLVSVERMVMISRMFAGAGVGSIGVGIFGGFDWTTLATMTTVWLASLTNLVLLAENRLSLPTEDSVTPLRLGFLAQFLLVVAWSLLYVNDPTSRRIATQLAAIGCVHLAVVALFTVTEERAVARRVLGRMRAKSRWRWLLASFGPGGGRGAAYVLVQMLILIAAVALFQPTRDIAGWLLAACGYICFFTGLPVLIWWNVAPMRATPLRLRVTVLVMVAAFSVLPDVVHYVLWRPEVLDLKFGVRHMLSPFRALGEWDRVEAKGWTSVAFVLGLTGVFAYLALMRLGAPPAEPSEPVVLHEVAPDSGETGRGNVRD